MKYRIVDEIDEYAGLKCIRIEYANLLDRILSFGKTWFTAKCIFYGDHKDCFPYKTRSDAIDEAHKKIALLKNNDNGIRRTILENC